MQVREASRRPWPVNCSESDFDLSPGRVNVHLGRCGCGSIACKHCGPGRGYALRRELLTRWRVLGVRVVGFVTLTLSPELWGDAGSEARSQIATRRLVAEFVRVVRRVCGIEAHYLSKVEFGKRGGRMHYHLLIDGLGYVPPGQLLILREWCLQRLGLMQHSFVSLGDHRKGGRIAGYIGKVAQYTAKDVGALPGWVRASCGFRFLSCSRGYWVPVRGKRKRAESGDGSIRGRATLQVRLEACGKTTRVIGESCSAEGEINRWFIGLLKMPLLEASVVLSSEGDGGAEAWFGYSSRRGEPLEMVLSWDMWLRSRQRLWGQADVCPPPLLGGAHSQGRLNHAGAQDF